jgi:hypothetical protein
MNLFDALVALAITGHAIFFGIYPPGGTDGPPP